MRVPCDLFDRRQGIDSRSLPSSQVNCLPLPLCSLLAAAGQKLPVPHPIILFLALALCLVTLERITYQLLLSFVILLQELFGTPLSLIPFN